MNHLSLDDLGDVEAAARHPHVARCEPCRRVLDEQRSVRDLLAALPSPGRAPEHVVRALEATLWDLEPSPSAVGRRERPLDLLGRRRRRAATVRPATRSSRTAPRLLAAAAAAAAVVGGGNLLAHTQADDAASSAAGGAAQLQTRSEQDAAAGTAQGAAQGAGQVLATGTAYTRATLTTQASSLVLRRVAAAQAGTPASGPLARPGGLEDCVRGLDTRARPVVADIATYDGKPAAVLVLAIGTAREVWVVGRDCRPGAEHLVLHTALR